MEVGGEPSGRLPGLVELYGEGPWLVLPGDAVEVEESGELPLALVSELDRVGRVAEVDGQLTPPWSR